MKTAQEIVAALRNETLKEQPRTFNEKLRWKMRYDRRALLTLTADKYNVIDYLKKIGFGHFLKNLYFATAEPALIPFAKLPTSYVVKSTHNTGDVILIKEGFDVLYWPFQKMTSEDIIAKCELFLGRRHWNEENEWAYKNIPAMIIVEELLYDNELSGRPRDFRFFCFGGKPKFIEVTEYRFGFVNYFDMNWQPLHFTWSEWPGQRASPSQIDAPKPVNFSELVEAAEALSKPFDFVRVDLYSCSGRVYFGEFTHYPCAAIGEFDPELWDSIIGQAWTLPSVCAVSGESDHDASASLPLEFNGGA